MKKLLIIAAAGLIIMPACVKQSWKCTCTITTTTHTNGQSSKTSYDEEVTLSHTTKNKAEAGPCEDTQTTHTYSDSKYDEVDRECTVK